MFADALPDAAERIHRGLQARHGDARALCRFIEPSQRRGAGDRPGGAGVLLPGCGTALALDIQRAGEPILPERTFFSERRPTIDELSVPECGLIPRIPGRLIRPT